MAPKSFAPWALFIIAFFFAGQVIAEDILFSGESLTAGQYLESGPYRFIMQGDCNLVLYTGSRALWDSRTGGRGTTCRATLQNNGNLVVLLGTDVIWTSNIVSSSTSYRLIMQGDGNVVIYGAALWNTNTVQSRRRLLQINSAALWSTNTVQSI
ncbi:hypothetical protein ACHQM5_007651 [Ranunculus cassubicifolius]